jgi:alkanesulfonate monooxygenase SsuD/methylene tetrahydromethanopterin reductase-like flavin-dependent oxidoreductase (luciferase family)
MTDYGHDLLFGTFLTPNAADIEHTLRLARLTDQLGLDLVTVQDHPYQGKFVDTWTLLSVIAAATVNVRVSPNVANLPLRPPAVLAKSVATLDLLSNGRVELGLGAGAFWDGVEAMGGTRLTPSDSVTALEEGIAVIRAMWDTTARSARVPGRFHALAGVHPGPAPAHDVEIWLGAYKPRMLALTGRLADGWLPSHAYAKPEELTEMNRIVDEAATAAGRPPEAIRRLYNISGRFSANGRGWLQGPPRSWAEQLAELTLTEGMSTYILGGDDPADIQRFAEEVVPAVRELVLEGRSSTPRAVAAPSTNPVPATTSRLDVVPTPDDGTRLSDERIWDETQRPDPPEYPDDRDYDAHDTASAQHLIDVHDGLRGELSRIRDLTQQVLAGTIGAGAARSQIQTMTIRQNKWTLGTHCEAYCRIVTTHHTIEDQSLFPHLRWSDPDLKPVIGRLQEEHLAIHDVIERVDRALVAFVNGPGQEDVLQSAVDLLTDTLLSHLSYEERSLVEPLARFGMA